MPVRSLRDERGGGPDEFFKDPKDEDLGDLGRGPRGGTTTGAGAGAGSATASISFSTITSRNAPPAVHDGPPVADIRAEGRIGDESRFLGDFRSASSRPRASCASQFTRMGGKGGGGRFLIWPFAGLLGGGGGGGGGSRAGILNDVRILLDELQRN